MSVVYGVVNVEWYYLGSRGAYGGILLMCDRGWWKGLRNVLGLFQLLAPLEVSMKILSGLLQVFMVPMMTKTGKCFRTNWRG
jgi:hypothetical protein